MVFIGRYSKVGEPVLHPGEIRQERVFLEWVIPCFILVAGAGGTSRCTRQLWLRNVVAAMYV